MSDNTKVADLLPCPFCGPGESIVACCFDDVANRYRVYCGRCGSSTGIHPTDRTEAPAIAAWNRRAALARQDVEEVAPPAAQAVDQWQPIEAAPKDGTVIIVTGAPEFGYTIPCVVDALYDNGGWQVNQWESPGFAITPTHWMPIPPIDQQAGKGGAA